MPYKQFAIASWLCCSPLHGHHQRTSQLFNLIVIYEYPHEQASLRSPVVDRFKLSSPPLDLCVQFSGDADFEDFEEGDPL